MINWYVIKYAKPPSASIVQEQKLKPYIETDNTLKLQHTIFQLTHKQLKDE